MENRFSFLCVFIVLVILWRVVVLENLPISLYVDEAQYWTWSKALDWGYFSKPPMVAFLVFLSTQLLGDSVLGVKFLAMLCYPATSLVFYATARLLNFSKNAALWAALLILTLPIFAWLGLVVSSDAILCLFWSLSFYFFIRAESENRLKDWLFLGACVGLGLLSKYSMAVFLLSAVLYRPSLLKNARAWCAVFVAFFILLPNILWNVANDFPTFKHTAEITIAKQSTGGFLKCAQFFVEQWLVSGGVIGAVFVFLCCKKSSWKNKKFKICAFFALPFWAIVGLQAFLKNANANWAAPAFLTATLAAMIFLEKRQKLLAMTLAIEIFISVLAYHWIFIAGFLTTSPEVIYAPFVRAQGFKELAHHLRPVLKDESRRVLAADNRTIIAHLRYELRDLNLKIVSWNPNQTQKDYYQMTTDWNLFKNHNILFVSDFALSDEKVRNISRYFEDFEKNPTLTVENGLLYPQRRVFLYKFNRFKGFSP